MKKVFIIGGYPKSLIQFRGKLLESFIKEGYRVTACSDGIDSDTIEKLKLIGIEYIPASINRTRINPLYDLILLVQLFFIIKKLKPDIVLTYTVKPVIYGMIAARLAGVKNRYAMITGLGHPFTSVDSLSKKMLRLIVASLYKISLIKVKVVFFQNNDDLNLFKTKNIISTSVDSVRVMGSGVDVNYYKFEKELPEDISFIMASRLLNDKGIREYAEAARIVKNSKFGNKVNFYLLGAFDSNPTAIQPNDLKQWESNGFLKYLGEVEDVRPYIKNSSVFVLPSYREGMPRSVLEAMSIGRAIITTDVPGCRDTVINNKNGYLVKSKSAEELAIAMLKILANPEDIISMGIQSRKMAENSFKVSDVNKIILNKIKQYLKPKEKLLIATSTSIFFSDILVGQPKYLNKYYQVSLAAGDDKDVNKITKHEKLHVSKISMNRGLSPIFDIFSLVSAILLILKIRPKIIQTFTPKAGFIFMIASWLCRTPIRIHTYTGLIFPTEKGLMKRVIMLADKLLCMCAKYIVAEGQGVKNDLYSFNITKKDIKIIGDGNVAGVDTSFYSRSIPDLKEVNLSTTNSDFVLCFVGRLAIDKGIKELINAFIVLPENMLLILVGNLDNRAPIGHDLLHLINTHERIHWVGFQDDIRPYLNLSNILVLPSYREGFPNVVLQALSMETPVIASNVNGSNEIIIDGENGWLIPKQDTNALVEAIIVASKYSKDNLNLMGKVGRAIIKEKFEKKDHLLRVLNFYDSKIS